MDSKIDELDGREAFKRLASMTHRSPGMQLLDCWEAFQRPRNMTPNQMARAIDIWLETPNPHDDRYPPEGAIVLFDKANNSMGMIGIAGVDGHITLTIFGTAHTYSSIGMIEVSHKATYLGWTDSFMGHKIRTYNA